MLCFIFWMSGPTTQLNVASLVGLVRDVAKEIVLLVYNILLLMFEVT